EMETGDAQRSYDIRKAAITDLAGLFEAARQEVYNVTHFNQPFTIEVDPELPSFVGDALYLRMAFVQLIDNAVKFSGDNAPIACGAKRVGDEIPLWVQDHGRGIEMPQQQHIWETFYQIDRSKFEDQGTGSGLAIVDHITRLHHGHTEVESHLQEGSTFTI